MFYFNNEDPSADTAAGWDDANAGNSDGDIYYDGVGGDDDGDLAD